MVETQTASAGAGSRSHQRARIEVFVYPQAWPTHVQWAAMLLILICRGPGELSIDQLLWRRFRHLLGAESPTASNAAISR
jgi:uncharacterized membrane protein YphA (DoxX/SURF4 family)